MEKQVDQDLTAVTEGVTAELDKLDLFSDAVLARQVEDIDRTHADVLSALARNLARSAAKADEAAADVRRFQTQPGSVTNSYL